MGELVYFGGRFYDPEVGRWLSPDPRGYQEGANLYQFILNNPLVYYDFYGFSAEKPSLFLEHAKYVYWYTTRSTLEGISTFDPKKMVAPVNMGTAIYHLATNQQVSPKNGGSAVYALPGKRHSSVDFYVAPGILTTKEEALDIGRYVQSRINGYEVKVSHKETHGFLLDTFDFFAEKFRIKNHSTQLFSSELYETLQSGRRGVIIPHSGGNACTKVAMMNMTRGQRNNFEIYGFGVADIHPEHAAAVVKNYISGNDLVAFMGNKYKCIKASVLDESHVTFLQPTSYHPIEEHLFLGDTYKMQLNKTLDDLIDRYSLE